MSQERHASRRVPWSDAPLRAACEVFGFDAGRASLLRLGENAIYRIANEAAILRIARSMDSWTVVEKEVAVASWLADEGLSAASTWSAEQPISAAGHPVTCWRYIAGRNGNAGDVAELGRVLRRLHGLPEPTGFDLPLDDVLARVEPRINNAEIPREDREFLYGRLTELSAQVGELDFATTPTVIHGDAHVQNLMFVDTQSFLIDFERVAFGQSEWDLAVTATEYVTAGWWTDEQYAEFVRSYGFDVMSWSGFDTLRRVHEIKMTTWLMQNIGESPDIEREYHVRMQTIRGERNDRAWRTF